ncbi:MAG: DUF742 domain-containing protein [Pseudonocardiales bacterium]|nr:DUF742 domain-containing protein [Pseudonocardiales bacterium]
MTTGDSYGARSGGRVVPAYAFTAGRTRSAGQSQDMPIEALVTATELAGRHSSSLDMEYRSIVELGCQPVSVVEIGAALRVPVGVARVLVSDLANAGYLKVHLPQSDDTDGRPGSEILGRLLDGLRAR